MLIPLAVILMIVFTSCDPAAAGGGLGADFDETLYYTKAEVDDLLGNAVAEAKTYADGLGSTIAPLSGDGPHKKVSDLFNTAVDPYWTVPDGVTIGIFKVECVSLSGTSDIIYFGPAEGEIDNYPLPTARLAFTAAIATEGNGTLFGWTNDADNDISVTCLYWIK